MTTVTGGHGRLLRSRQLKFSIDEKRSRRLTKEFLPEFLRPVHLDDVLLGDLLVNQELCHYFALVTLELDNIPQLLVLHDCAVAVELLLALFQNHLFVDFWVHALHSGQRLASVSLLRADVDVPGLHRVGGLIRLFLSNRTVVVCEVKIRSCCRGRDG